MTKSSSIHFELETKICFLLIIAVFLIYSPSVTYDFINLDDNVYVSQNTRVQGGFSSENLRWAFTTNEVGTWQPLVWLTYIAQWKLFGGHPGGFHMVNCLFHIANTILLFLLFSRMTKEIWKSLFVATLFAVHPLHVESVVWITELKDVLSTFFWMLTMICYHVYHKHPSVKRYGVTLLMFALGLMAKPMLVTLPFVLLLVDFWPLNRIHPGRLAGEDASKEVRALLRCIFEKVPFFILTAISSIVTFIFQEATVQRTALFDRAATAILSYVSYIVKMFFPFHLSVIYPHPGPPKFFQAAGAGCLLIVITLSAIWLVRKYPYFLFGWLWYMGTIFPVIGIVEFGKSLAMADRFTYVPFIGLFVIFTWGISDAISQKRLLAAGASLVALFFTVLTALQIGYWKDSETLFTHAIDVTENNYLAHNNLGIELLGKGDTESSLRHFNTAIQIKKDYSLAYNNKGWALKESGLFKEAVPVYYKSILYNPQDADTHYNLGLTLTSIGKIKDGIKHLGEVFLINPSYESLHGNLGVTLVQLKKYQQAFQYFRDSFLVSTDFVKVDRSQNTGNKNQLGEGEGLFLKGTEMGRQKKTAAAVVSFNGALKMGVESPELFNNYGVTRVMQGRVEESVRYFEEALRRNPLLKEALNNLGVVCMKQGGIEKAISYFQQAIAVFPGYVKAYNNLGILFLSAGKINEADQNFQIANKTDPTDPFACYNIASIYAIKGESYEASTWLRKAEEKGFEYPDFFKNDVYFFKRD